ncbi:rcc01693 family protein [Rhizobium sp. FKY42]|uniref:rcc01693 family protein n=1 Tax=Rhizobium sp. FKY42 TaxID=2562310 RepID=UPI001485B6FC|nr:rcc01693 family protein [Rhizobium sp. FKY42]
MSAATGAPHDGATAGWPGVLHVGLCLLRLPPDIFWQLSPREFMGMAGAYRPRPPGLDRAGLVALMAAFPDLPFSSD